MSNEVITWLKAELAKFEGEAAPEITTAETDAEAIGSAALAYIKTQGLTDLYAIAKSVLLSVAAGAPWATTLATVVTQGEVAGISIAKGAEAVVVAQAQADLIAAGQLGSPAAPPAA